MAFSIRKVDYYYATIRDQPGEAYKLLSDLAECGVNLLAFTSVPIGPGHNQLTIIPEDDQKLQSEAKKVPFTLDGPHPALFVRGDDELGALADIHRQLHENNVTVYASSGISHSSGSYGYLLYIKPEEFSAAAKALGLEHSAEVSYTALKIS
jgi:hypothetical protein